MARRGKIGRGAQQHQTRLAITRAFLVELSEDDIRRRNIRREGPKCASCGSFEDLKGHVDASKSSDIFYLCAKCCDELHNKQ